MIRNIMTVLGGLLLAFGLVAIVGSQRVLADTEGVVAEGRKISEQHCARCHVVGDYNRNGGISSTPSFELLVRRRPDFVARFETFFVRRPHPAFVMVEGHDRLRPDLPPNAHPIKLPYEAIAKVLEYAKTLVPVEKRAASKRN